MVAHNSYRGVVIRQRDFISEGDIAKDPDKDGYNSRRKALLFALACTKRDSIQLGTLYFFLRALVFFAMSFFSSLSVGAQQFFYVIDIHLGHYYMTDFGVDRFVNPESHHSLGLHQVIIRGTYVMYEVRFVAMNEEQMEQGGETFLAKSSIEIVLIPYRKYFLSLSVLQNFEYDVRYLLALAV